MKLSTKLITISLLGLFILSSCSSEDLTNNKNISKENINKSRNLNITGKVQFGDEQSQGFKIKNISPIAVRATVSLIYPSDHIDINLRNTTIATGLSDLQGNFIINPTQNFIPEVNKVMVLEASKRIGGAGNSSISLRTNIRWSGTKWESITSPDIIITRQTTSLSIISSLSANIMTSSESINKVIYENGIGNVLFDTKLTPGRFNAVNREVENLMADFKDPVENIMYLSPLTGTVNYYTRSSYLQSNMYTLRTMVETYAVDWGGVYPPSMEGFEQEAKTRGYWINTKNPFYFYYQIPPFLPLFMNKDEYEQAKLTLNYKGNTLTDKAQLRGTVLYESFQNNGVNLSYSIYGVDIKGNLLKNDERDENSQIYFLTNQ